MKKKEIIAASGREYKPDEVGFMIEHDPLSGAQITGVYLQHEELGTIERVWNRENKKHDFFARNVNGKKIFVDTNDYEQLKNLFVELGREKYAKDFEEEITKGAEEIAKLDEFKQRDYEVLKARNKKKNNQKNIDR